MHGVSASGSLRILTAAVAQNFRRRCILRRTMSTAVEINEEYEQAVRALNGLQTSADIITQNRETRSNHTDLMVLEQRRRRDQNYHRECRSKLLHMQEYLESSGIKLHDLDKLNAIHITGTKGKGSVCAMSEIILRRHNLKTGFFSSPHLLEVRERIRLNGVPLPKTKFATYFWECYNLLKKEHEMKMPTYFKFLTIMSFYVFLKEKVDVAVVEVGIGGAYDCTNIIPKPAVCAVTSLGYDHMEILGYTLEKIAWQKGGIFKQGCPAFVSPQFPGPMKVLEERAAELGASALHVAPPFNEYPSLDPPLRLGLAGDHQKTNASLAVQVCQSWLQSNKKLTQDSTCSDTTDSPLGKDVPVARPFPLTDEFRQGLEQCWWPGRNQVIKKGRVTYYLDGAHTPQSVKTCYEWFKVETKLEEEAVKGSVIRILLFNVTKDRDSKLLMQPLLNCRFKYAAFTPNIGFSQGTNSADQTNLTVSVDSQHDKARSNLQAWLDVNNCPDNIELSNKTHCEGLVTSSPDPLALCGHRNKSPSFERDNAYFFPSINDFVKWCDPNWDREGRSQTLPTPLEIAGAECIQILVTGSLHLVGDTMMVLGTKLEDLVKP